MRPNEPPPGWETRPWRRAKDWERKPLSARRLAWAIYCGETMLIQWADFTPVDKARFKDCKERLEALGHLAAARSTDRLVRFVMDDWLRRTAAAAQGQRSPEGDTNLQGGGEKTP